MYLDKVITYAKAHASFKVDEQAMVHQATASADVNTVLAYKKGQHPQSQASQAQRGGYQGGQQNQGSNFS
jgi:hypothetical protein